MLSNISFTHNEEDYLAQYMRNRVVDDHQEQGEQEEYSNYQHGQLGDNTYGYEGEQGNEYQQQQQQSRQISEKEDEDQSHLQTYSVEENNVCNDSFLDLVDNHLETLKQKAQTQTKQQQSMLMMKQSFINSAQIISLSKHQLSYCLLQNQSTTDTVQLTNLLPIKSTAKIINAPFQFRLLNAKNKFLKRDEVEIILQPFESVEIEFEIKKRQNEIGNIYETLRVDAYQMADGKSVSKSQSKYVKFQITFVKPKFQVNFIGRTFVKRVQQHKVAQLEIYPNEMGQYSINLVFSQDQFSTLNSSRLERIQCQIQTKGYVSIHPNSVILYQNQPLKISLRRLTQSSGIGKTSVILIKPINSSLTYVIGVKCMERVQKTHQQQPFIKMSKMMI